MTAVETVRARLPRAAAARQRQVRHTTPERRTAGRTATASPRHDDSGAQSASEDASESVLSRSMTTPADGLPDDIGALRALILAERAEREQFAERIGRGSVHAAVYTLVMTCKLNNVDPRAWLADVLARLPNHPARRIADVLTWTWKRDRIKVAA